MTFTTIILYLLLMFVGPTLSLQADDAPHAISLDDQIFSQSSEVPYPISEPAPARPDNSDPFAADEASLFGEAPAKTTVSPDAAPEDPLRIGGQFYSRFLLSFPWDSTPEPSRFDRERLAETTKYSDTSFPTLVDLYMDARPNDRVRAFLNGRMNYNPSNGTEVYQPEPDVESETSDEDEEVSEASTLSSTSQDDLNVVLNQLWFRFDISRRVFVTAGKQSVKWGTGRFWNPTDFLQPVRQNPLELFDTRVGISMVKLHIPWEARAWNFYALGLLDTYQPPDSLNRLGLAARAEAVFGAVELGIDGALQNNRVPKMGLDISAGVGPIDIYGELALRDGSDLLKVRSTGVESSELADRYETFQVEGITSGATVGANWSTILADDDNLTIGIEYFFNSLGYDDQELYLGVLYKDLEAANEASSEGLSYQPLFQPFYLGRHYASIYASLNGPGSWNNTSITISTIGNLSDRSGVSRLDISAQVLTFLRVEFFSSLYWGNLGGEFRMEIDSGPVTVYGFPTSIYLPATAWNAGLSLRVNL